MSTPMQQQFKQVKEQYPNSLVLFRLGDFYETFDEDAKLAAKVLGITLTGRGKGENRRPMAGIPHHALDNYLPKLVSNGHKVVIVDQVSTPEPGKLVEREVTEVISPGVIVDEKLLKENTSNYLACMYIDYKKGEDNVSVHSLLFDVGTSECLAFSFSDSQELDQCHNLLNKYQVKEVVANETAANTFSTKLSSVYIESVDRFETAIDADFDIETGLAEIRENMQLNSLKAWDIDNNERYVGVVNALRRYLLDNLSKELDISNLQKNEDKGTVNVPWNTYRALEVFSDSRGNEKNSLFAHINRTLTAAGKRKLRYWMLNIPLDREQIISRYDSIDQLSQLRSHVAEEIDSWLGSQIDYDRTVSKWYYNKLKPYDLLALSQSIIVTITVKSVLQKELSGKSKQTLLTALFDFDLDQLAELAKIIDNTIAPQENDLSKPGFIRPESDEELNKIVKQVEEGKQFLQQLEERESKRTQINSLKVKKNKVFGYYIEISKANLGKVPEDYIRKQTLVNAERYITPELKEWEEKVERNAEIRLEMELKIYEKLLTRIEKYIDELQALSKVVSDIDVINSFSILKDMFAYVRPEIVEEDSEEEIVGMKHPLLAEKLGSQFVSNDVSFKPSQRFQVITGPNMAGKSTFIRSCAIVYLLAQLGCYVPAERAKIQLVDGIYSRVGASDNLTQNESTFMVEMVEMAYILNNSSSKSLVVLDEVGRGTSTYDGLSLAWAITEEMSQKTNAKTLFATHYHELTALEHTLTGVKNFYVEAIAREKLFFTHKVKPGSLNKSFGVEVAKMAGVEQSIISRAKEVLEVLEAENDVKSIAQTDLNYSQLGLLSQIPSARDTEKVKESVSKEVDQNKTAIEQQKLKIIADLEDLQLEKISPIELFAKITDIKKELDKLDN